MVYTLSPFGGRAGELALGRLTVPHMVGWQQLFHKSCRS